jgi:hypothetical protein
MCFGGKSKSQPQQQAIPAPNPPTTFDYTAAQAGANQKVAQAQAASMLSQTKPNSAFGSELGGAPAATPQQ